MKTSLLDEGPGEGILHVEVRQQGEWCAVVREWVQVW